jgi:hypothetical protein
MTDNTDEKQCPQCKSFDWDWANVGIPEAVQCCDCGFIYNHVKKPWVEITKGQIDDCLKHSDNYDFAWAIEHICRLNNGYPPHENFKEEWS